MPALDDEFAKDTGEADTLDGLRDKVRERLLEADKERIKQRADAQELVKELLKRNAFPVAPALVERHAQLIVQRAKQQLAMRASTSRRIDDERMRDELREQANDEVRAAFLVDAIAERERIRSRRRLEKRIAEMAAARDENAEAAARRATEGAAPRRARSIRSARRRPLTC